MRFAKTMFLAGLFATLNLSADTLPEPFASIYQLSPTPYYFENGYLLVDKVNTEKATVFIDVGSQGGSAARLIAQYTQGVKIYNVNIWQSCDSQQKNGYQKFLSNLIAENTAERIIPIRMSSIEAAKALNVIAEVIYLDSIESTLSSEILAWAPHLAPSGTICGHDWTDPNVQYTVAQAANKLGFLVKSNGDFWYLERN